LAARRKIAPGGMDQKGFFFDCAQGAVTEPLGIALAGFRQCDDALRKRRTNGSSQPGVAPSEASAISKAIPI
jgi:hypothetical protein